MRPQFTFLTIAGALLTAGLSTAATPAVAASSGTFAPTGSMIFATARANPHPVGEPQPSRRSPGLRPTGKRMILRR
jgi:hypothetical protein